MNRKNGAVGHDGFLVKKLGVAPENVHLLGTAYAAFFTSGMVSTVLGAILPNLKEAYGISYLLTGSAYSFHQIGNLSAVLVAGFLPYALGRKKSTMLLLTGLVAGVLLISFVGTPAVLLLAFALTGIGRGTASNITNVVVADTTRNKTAGLNILHAVFALGALLSPFVLILLSVVSAGTGWRITLWLIAVCMLLVIGSVAASSLSTVPESRNTAVLKEKNGNLPPFYRSGTYWLNTAILTFYLCGESANMGWLVTYFKDSGLMGQTFAQITSSLMWIMMMGGRLMCASISGKINRSKLVLILAALNTLFFLLMISTRCLPVIIIGLLGTGFSMSGIYPTTLSTMKPQYNSSTVAVGTCMGVALTGAITMPIVVGMIAQHVKAAALSAGVSVAAAENKGVTSGISAISVALAIMLILAAVKYVVSRNQR